MSLKIELLKLKWLLPSSVIAALKYFRFQTKSDERFLAMSYEKRFSNKINFDNPVTFNEKIIARKLVREPKFARELVDKLKVKRIIRENKQRNLSVIPTLSVINIDELNMNFLTKILRDNPNGIYIKLNHDSGSVFKIDKGTLNKKEIKKIKRRLRAAMKCNYYWSWREWVYSDIEPKIFIEPHIGNKEERINDYKFFVLNQKVEFALIIEEGRRQFFDRLGKRLPFDWDRNPDYNLTRNLAQNCVPKQFFEMVKMAEEMSYDFQLVRMDYYLVAGTIYFGEYTFFPNDGLNSFDPPEWDLKFGQILDTSKKSL